MAIAAGVIFLALSGWIAQHPWGWLVLLGLGLGYWYWRRSPRVTTTVTPHLTLQPQQVKAELAQTRALLQELPAAAQARLQHTYEQLQHRLDTPTVEVCILGQSCRWVAHLARTVEGLGLPHCHLHQQSLATVPQADLVLLTVTGALTASEFEMVRVLVMGQYRLVIVWLPENMAELERVKVHLQQQLHQLSLKPEQLLCITPTDNTALATMLSQILSQERSSLVCSGTYRCAQQLHQQAQTALNAYRRERSQPIIERYQWLGAAATAVNPLPLLDLVMAGGLLVRLTWELGQIYHRSFRLADAEPIAKELLRLVVQLGAVELGTQSLGQWLKGHSLTYLAGSCLQGATAAYVLRLSGLSLIHYFETVPHAKDMPFSSYLRQSVQWARRQVGRSPLQALGASMGLTSSPSVEGMPQ
ncbi:YcjF family protein [Parathermosynechococcus lividus]